MFSLLSRLLRELERGDITKEEPSVSPGYVERLLAAFPDQGQRASAEEQAQPSSPHGAASSSAGPLSARELELLRLVARGSSTREIAEELIITEGTVKRHLHNIYGKLDAGSRTQAIATARRLGLLTD